MFICPAYPPREFTNWFETYGVWTDPPESVRAGQYKEDLVVTAVSSRVEYFHLTDTTSRGRMGLGSVQFNAFRTNATDEVHARHNLTANVWFLDGHAESLRRADLEKLRIPALFGQDTIPGYFP